MEAPPFGGLRRGFLTSSPPIVRGPLASRETAPLPGRPLAPASGEVAEAALPTSTPHDGSARMGRLQVLGAFRKNAGLHPHYGAGFVASRTRSRPPCVPVVAELRLTRWLGWLAIRPTLIARGRQNTPPRWSPLGGRIGVVPRPPTSSPPRTTRRKPSC